MRGDPRSGRVGLNYLDIRWFWIRLEFRGRRGCVSPLYAPGICFDVVFGRHHLATANGLQGADLFQRHE